MFIYFDEYSTLYNYRYDLKEYPKYRFNDTELWCKIKWKLNKLLSELRTKEIYQIIKKRFQERPSSVLYIKKLERNAR